MKKHLMFLNKIILAIISVVGVTFGANADTYNITYNLNGGLVIPSDYTPVEYIENDGRVRMQFPHANLYDSDNIKIYTKWMTTNTTYYNNSSANIGILRQNGKNTVGATLRYGTNDTYTLYGNTQTGVMVNNIAPNTQHEMWATTGSVTLDDTKYTTSYGASTRMNEGVPPAFFAWERGKLYDVYVEKNGAFVYAGIPVRRDSDGMCAMIRFGANGNANFNEPNQNLDNGTAAFTCPNVSSKPDTYTTGVGADVVYEPLRVNSKFVGWCDDANLTQNCAKTRNISTSETGDKTLYAKWECYDGYTQNAAGTACVANTITITYNSNGGSAVSNATCSYDKNLTLPTAPTRQNYTFTGWNTANNVVYSAGTTINGGCWDWITGVTSGTSDNVITAQWQQNNIIYELDGGTNNANNPDNYTVGTETTISGAPTKANYMFVGWCTDSAKTNCAMTQTIADTETGTFTLYAKFEQAKFQIGTSNLAANTTFGFQISARGTFYVDWGDGSAVQVIDRSLPDTAAADLTLQTVSHTYTTAGNRTIRFGGRATGYSTGTDVSTFKIGSTDAHAQLITSYAGRLGSIFPTLNDGSANNEYQPRFIQTLYRTHYVGAPAANIFYDANDPTNSVFGATDNMFDNTFSYSYINAVPSGLFAGANRYAKYMFKQTFLQNGYLTSIPNNLFIADDSCKEGLFQETFFNDAYIPTWPSDLFAHVTGCAKSCFGGTFSYASMVSIPNNFFPQITCVSESMFQNTFSNKATSNPIPADLFSNITNCNAGKLAFAGTFSNRGVTSVPSGLFSKICSIGDQGFYGTFSNDAKLTSLPDGLFYSVKTAGTQAFSNTFSNDTKLTSLPNQLFGLTRLNGSQTFTNTFYNTGLTSLPNDLFQSFTTQNNSVYGTFEATFRKTKLTSIPSNLFNKLNDFSFAVFNYTFAECPNLTEVPSGLFSHITKPIDGLFSYTFYNCPNLKYVPYDLFGSFTGRTPRLLFNNVFTDCTKLDSVVHPGQNGGTYTTSFLTEKFFGSLSPSSNEGIDNMFKNTGLATTCPENTSSFNTGFRSAYTTRMNNKVFCKYNINYENMTGATNNANNPATYIDNTTAITLNAPTKTGYDFDGWYGNSSFSGNVITDIPAYSYGAKNLYAKWVPHTYQCPVGQWLPKYNDWETNGYTGCIVCPLNNMCPGGYYSTNETTDQGITSCTTNPFAPTGSGVCYPHILHVGDNIAYLKSNKQTTPSLNVGLGNGVFYVNTTTTPTYMNKDSTKYLRIKHNNTNYYVCDDTTCP